MTEKREIELTARVFENPRPGASRGWYYQFEGSEPEGPYPSQLDAGTAARDVMVNAGSEIARAGYGAVVEVTGLLGGTAGIVGTITPTPERREFERRPVGKAINPPQKERRAKFFDRRERFDDAHFAGRDRRMTTRERRTAPYVPAHAAALAQDHRLDREALGRNKYSVISMRDVYRLTEDGTKQAAQDILRGLSLLRKHGVLNDGDAKTPGEFFVLMLKDEFSGKALLAYAAAAHDAGMTEYANDVLQISMRAGHGSPWCKRPD